MSPVSLPGAEIYESLQRGIVDCAMADAPDVLSSQLTEVAQHYTAVNLAGFTPYGIFMNQDTWESLPLDLQQIMWDELTVYVATLTEQGIALQEELLETENMTFHTAAQDLTDAVEAHHAEVLSEMVSTAPGSLADPESDLESYQELHEKWNGIVVDEMGVESAETWAEWQDNGGTLDDIDLEAYADRVMSEILAPHRP